jgi:hypothetical protein
MAAVLYSGSKEGVGARFMKLNHRANRFLLDRIVQEMRLRIVILITDTSCELLILRIKHADLLNWFYVK